MTKRNEPIIVCVACRLAALALVCMSMVPFVQAEMATARSGATETLAPAATVDVHRSAGHVHCDKTQSQMGYGMHMQQLNHLLWVGGGSKLSDEQ